MKISPEYAALLNTGVTAVTPTRRGARALAAACNAAARAAGRKAWATPDVVPWNTWVCRLYEHCAETGAFAGAPKFLLSDAQERVLWQRAIRSDDDCTDARLRRLARLAMSAWSRLHEWQLDPADVFRAPLSPGVAAFDRWSRAFTRACADLDALDRARGAVAVANGSSRLPRPAPALVLHGFASPSPLAARLAVRYGAAVHSPGPIGGAHPQAPAAYQRFAGTEAEIHAAARWACALVERDPATGVVVACADLRRLRRLVIEIFGRVFAPDDGPLDCLSHAPAFAVSGDRAALDHPLVGAALAILAVAARGPWHEISALLRSPYLGGSAGEWRQRAALDAYLRRTHGAEVTLDRVVEAARRPRFACHDFAGRVTRLRETRDRAPRRQTLHAWVADFERTLAAAGWPGDTALSAADEAAWRGWQRAVEALATLDAVTAPVARDDAVAELRAVLRGTDADPAGEVAVQVVTPEAAVALLPAYTWVAQLHDEAWPPPGDPHPLLPYRQQREAQIPGAAPAADTQRARTVLHAIAAGAVAPVYSYSTVHDGITQRASALLPALATAAVEPPGTDPQAYWPAPIATATREYIDDRRGPPLTVPGTGGGGVARFADQAACPFRGFARHRLGARSIDDPLPGLDARARGELLHATLERFWRAIRDQKELRELGDVGLHARAVACAEEAIAGMRTRFEIGAAVWELEKARLAEALRDLLRVDLDRPPFEVVAVEAPQVVRCGDLEIAVRIDRIDRVVGDGEVMIDYKTGTADRADWASPRPDQPQLPLYALHRDTGRVTGIAYAVLSKGACRYIDEPAGVVTAAADDPDTRAAWRARIALWRRELAELAREIADGHAAVLPKHGRRTCRHCDLPVLCRRHENPDARGGSTGDD